MELSANPKGRAVKAYIYEAAIDVISLYQLHKIQENNKQAYYISLTGAAKQTAIDRLNHSNLTLLLATNNDIAGQMCRNTNPDLIYVSPELKDWNEDLQTIQVRVKHSK